MKFSDGSGIIHSKGDDPSKIYLWFNGWFRGETITGQQVERRTDCYLKLSAQELDQLIEHLVNIQESHEWDDAQKIVDTLSVRKDTVEGGFKAAKGIFKWKEGDEKAEETIRRIRGNDETTT